MVADGRHDMMAGGGSVGGRAGSTGGANRSRSRDEAFSPRQQQVLTAALEALVEQGDRFTMTEVARRAKCSKETLYKWFGDREGLLTATIQWQAAKVRVPHLERGRLDAAALRAGIEQFAGDLLATIAGTVSVTLNRLAVTHAGPDRHALGGIMLEHGPAAIRRRGKQLLDAGHGAGLLRLDGSEEAYRTLFGLVVRDVQIRLLLGDGLGLSPRDIERHASVATDQFLALFGRNI